MPTKTPPGYGENAIYAAPRHDGTLPLKCSACGKLHKYAVGRIIVDPDWYGEVAHLKPIARMRHLAKIHWDKWVSFSGYFVCPGCGSGGPWKFPAAAKREMAWQMIRYTTSKGAEGVLVARPTLFDGYLSRSCFDGAAHLRGLIEADPSNAYLWNRLGNLLAAADEDERALPAFEKALELEPHCVETLHSLADHWSHKGDLARAARYFHGVLRWCRNGIWRNDRLKENVVQHTLERLVEMNQRTGGDIEVFPPADAEIAPSDPSQPPVVFLTSFDLSKDSDWQRLVKLFLHDPLKAPREQHSAWQRGRLPAPATPPIAGPPSGEQRVGRNDRCPCGSGKKFKHCCQRR